MPTTSATPRACLVFVLDQSASMSESPDGPWKAKAELVAAALNESLGFLIEQAREMGTEEAIDCGVIGYRTDRLARPVVGPLLGGQPLATLGAIGRAPTRSQARTREVVDDWSGEIIEESYDAPIWVEPTSSGGTPMLAALRACRALVESWAGRNRAGVPPLVIHLTDGLARDGDPTPEAESVAAVTTDQGPTLLVHCHVAARGDPQRNLSSPTDLVAMSSPLSASLFRMSSLWPSSFRRLVTGGSPLFPPDPRCRAMIFSADSQALREYLDLVTRAFLAWGR